MSSCYYCPCHNIFTWNEFFLDKFFLRTLQDPQPRKNPLLKLTKTAFLLIQRDDSCTAVVVDSESNNLVFFLLLFLLFPSAPALFALVAAWRRGSSFPFRSHLQWTFPKTRVSTTCTCKLGSVTQNSLRSHYLLVSHFKELEWFLLQFTVRLSDRLGCFVVFSR